MNEESQSLYEKLEEINEIKHKIKQAIIDIGGNAYIDDDTLFRLYPDAIYSIHSDLVNICTILNNVLNGGSEPVEESGLEFTDVIKYAQGLYTEKQKLVDYMNTAGVPVTINDSMDTLIEKLPQIEDVARERYLTQSY